MLDDSILVSTSRNVHFCVSSFPFDGSQVSNHREIILESILTLVCKGVVRKVILQIIKSCE